jgi:hypothetical protein
VHAVRMEEAKQRLETDTVSVEEIGHIVGYEDPTFFTRRLRPPGRGRGRPVPSLTPPAPAAQYRGQVGRGGSPLGERRKRPRRGFRSTTPTEDADAGVRQGGRGHNRGEKHRQGSGSPDLNVL